jgi:hypothetical protein
MGYLACSVARPWLEGDHLKSATMQKRDAVSEFLFESISVSLMMLDS